MFCAMPLVCPSIASHRTCELWALSEHVNISKTIESPAKCEVRAAIRLLYAEGCNIAELILQPFRHFTYITGHSPTLPLLHLRHSSFSNHYVASPTSQFILQPFFRFSYVTSYSLNSPGTHYSCSMNFSSIAPFRVKKPNYSTHFTFGWRLYCFRLVYMLTTRSELTGAMWRDQQTEN